MTTRRLAAYLRRRGQLAGSLVRRKYYAFLFLILTVAYVIVIAFHHDHAEKNEVMKSTTPVLKADYDWGIDRPNPGESVFRIDDKRRLKYQVSQRRPTRVLYLAEENHNVGQDSFLIQMQADHHVLNSLIRAEMNNIPDIAFASWGWYGVIPPLLLFPPEITFIDKDRFYERDPPPQFQGNQIILSHASPGKNVHDVYLIQRLEHKIKQDGAENVGIVYIGDELNYGSSFLNDGRDGSSSPFSFFIRYYYFEPLTNAEYTQIIQLGTMTCRDKWFPCSVWPRDVVFVDMLPSLVPHAHVPTILKKASERSKRCYWAGSFRGDREEMYTYFKTNGGCEVYDTREYNKGDEKNVYANKLADSAFGLNPAGNSPETHRLQEMLMFGVIPVMLEKDAQALYLKQYEEPIPIVTGRTWEEVHRRMEQFDVKSLDELQDKVLQWWIHHVSCVQEDLRWIQAQAHAVSQGRDLCSSFQG
jgi:hypothetical protein